MRPSQLKTLAIISCVFTVIIGQKLITKDNRHTHSNPLALSKIDYGFDQSKENHEALRPIGKRIAIKPATYDNSPRHASSTEESPESISTQPVNYENSPIESSSRERSPESIEVRAFLDTIAWAEVGTADTNGYQTLVFGKQFNDFSTHPKIKNCAVVNGKNLCSTAAGRYQILDKTWDELAPKLGLTDFSPDSQDTIAIALIDERGALEDIEAGQFEKAISKVSNIWASLPGNNYNQNPKSIEELRDVYDQFVKFYGSY